MTQDAQRGNKWARHVVAFLLIAAACHVATVWLLPRLIMWRVMNGPALQEIGGANRVAHPPPVDALARRIVMPSPDLLYSICMLDLRQGPVRIQADPRWPAYWSVALYAANSNNYFVRNDRDSADKPLDVWVIAAPADAAKAPPGALVVTSPSAHTMLLARLLTSNYAAQSREAEAARRTVRCTASAS